MARLVGRLWRVVGKRSRNTLGRRAHQWTLLPHRSHQSRTERSHQMNIPEEAVEAAAKALAELEPGEDWPSNIDLGGHALLGTRDDEFKRAMEQDAKRALTAALPHIEAALRKQIATDIRAVANGPTDWDDGYYEGRHDAARIAEEGTTK